MEEKLNLILKVLALRLRIDYGFTLPEVEALVKEIDEAVKPKVISFPQTKVFEASPSQKIGRLKSLITKKIKKGD